MHTIAPLCAILQADQPGYSFKMLLVLCFVAFLFAVLSSPGLSQLQSGPRPQIYESPTTCLPTQFFQSGNLSCLPCSGGNQRVSEDGLSCMCDFGHISILPSGGRGLQCQPCGTNLVSSRNGLFCLSCDEGYDVISENCNECSSNTQIIVESLPASSGEIGNRSCIDCPFGTWANQLKTECIQCGIEDCSQCVVTDGVCFESSLPAVLFQVFGYYTAHFTAAMELCRTGRNATSCQLLGNLCVLQLYLPTDAACEQSVLLAGSFLPMLYYPSRGADEVLRRNDIVSELFTRQGANELPLVAAVYSLNGSFIGLDDIITDDIILCHDRPSRLIAALRVGAHYQIECSLSVKRLMQLTSGPLFYDIYLRDTNGDTDQLYPIPVLIANYRDSNGAQVNRGNDVNQWQLVRRFYLVQSVTDNPLYARSIKLVVQLSSNGRLFPPYLEIEYESWNPLADDQTLPSSFVTEYSHPGYNFTIGLCVSLFLLACLVAIYAGFRLNGFLRRTGGQCCNPRAVVFVVVEFCGGLSTAIFILLTVTAIFWLLFFKVQTRLLFTLPLGNQELAFQIILCVGLLCRIIHVLYLMWCQCMVDIFFIDWEKSRGLIVTPNQPVDGGSMTTPTSCNAPISIWRTYFVANEWNEIQSIRKINPTLLLCLVLLFGHVVGLQFLAERDPSSNVSLSESRYSPPHSSILRFAITSVHFIIIGVLLRLFVFLVYERFIEHKIHQFVDLCSVSNISVFILSHTLYGHYIHGRSVHGHTDTNMREMNNSLLKEQNNTIGQRGLEMESDVQTYEMAIKIQVRNQYNKIVSEMADSRGQSSSDGGMKETTIRAYEEMNKFLSMFIDKSIQGMNYVVKSKLLVEKILRMEFFDNETMSMLYRDPGLSFDQVLFYGNEWTLFLLDLMVFAVVDLLSESYVLAAVITFTVFWLLAIIRNALGRRNIGRKTLVDERFLI